MKVEHVRADVIALRPIYKEAGNATEILLKNGETITVDRGIKSVLKALAFSYALDLTAQRKSLSQRLEKKIGIPFWLEENRIFVPLKMRKAISPNDSVHGYLDVAYVDKIESNGKNSCALYLTNGRMIEILNSKKTAMEKVHLGLTLMNSSCSDRERDNQTVTNSAMVLGETIVKIMTTLNNIEKKVDALQKHSNKDIRTPEANQNSKSKD